MGIKVVNGGFLTTIQDMGRYGYQETGLAVSGVMDTRSAALAAIWERSLTESRSPVMRRCL